MTAKAGELAKRHGLTLPHLEVLLCLNQGEGISQQDLAERLLLTKGNICVMVQKMEAAGLIERRSDPDDQRFHRLYMAPAGKQKLREIHAGAHGHDRPRARGPLAGEQKTLHELLCRIDDTLNEDED